MHWPHRALRSIEKKIASLCAEAKFTNDQISIDQQVVRPDSRLIVSLSRHSYHSSNSYTVDTLLGCPIM